MAEVLAFVFAALCFAAGSVSAYRQHAASGFYNYNEALWYACAGAACASVAVLSLLNS